MLVIEVEILELLNCEGPINGVKYIRRRDRRAILFFSYGEMRGVEEFVCQGTHYLPLTVLLLSDNVLLL